LTKALANEWAAQGVNVNAIAPGYMRTDNTSAPQRDEVRKRQIIGRIPAARWGEPDDICGAAVFLASPASDYIHGHVLFGRWRMDGPIAGHSKGKLEYTRNVFPQLAKNPIRYSCCS
jgi:NAD(P)-dependent dehydrogenase (short-subunit alcohol dehydrogenase family)